MKSLINISIITLLIFSCDEPKEIYGCMDSQSCNYNPNSTQDNNSCLYLDECGECGGDNTSCLDECGVVNGDDSTCLDECGVINGDNTECLDECGVVNGDNFYVDEICGSCSIYLWGECYNIEETTYLNLFNSVTGEIPSEIGNLTNLTYLGLINNELTGEIPSEIGNLTNLTYLNLNNNELTGQIPSEIGNLTNLIHLYLSFNQLTGEIPLEICNQGDSTPSVGNNNLCPPYPDCISQSDIDSQDTSDCP